MKTIHLLKSGFADRRILVACFLCFAGALLAGYSLMAKPLSKAQVRQLRVAQNKIAPWLLARLPSAKQIEFLVVMADQADTRSARTLPTKEEKGRFVRDELWNQAQTTQASLRALLDARRVEYRSFYIVNALWVKGDVDLAYELAARSDVQRIEGNPSIHNALPQPLTVTENPSQPQSPTVISSGVTYARAPEVWALGYTGQGVVIAGADTGIRWDHNALKPHYRGWNGTTADHNYNWHDSIHNAVASNSCGSDLPAPCDDHGHGTHTIGTAVGDDGAGNQIGMAPGAKWIGCRNMDRGVGTPARYLECMEFFLAPYPIGGTPAQGDSTKAPDITTNSWGCPTSEGCSTNTLLAGVQAQRDAGIEMVAAAGNSGAGGCSTVSDPPSFYGPIYTVGALTTSTDTIAAFSSRGPATADGSNRRKPDICASGTNIRSSVPATTSSYESANWSGTSMATPHVAGAAALLISAQPLLRHDWERIEQLINNNAVHINSAACDTVGTTWPNNVFGYGRIDIKAAVDKALVLLKLTGAVSRKSHAGINHDIALPLSGPPGVECRDSGGNHTLIFTFTNNMAGGSATVISGTGNVVGSPSFAANTMTVQLAGIPEGQRSTIRISGATDTLAQTLADTDVTFGVLLGDASGDGSVNSADVTLTKSNSGQTLDEINFKSDLNMDGGINSADISMVKSKSGTALP